MGKTKISNNKNKESFSKNLILNTSIIILVLINIYLGYTVAKSAAEYFSETDYDPSLDSTASSIRIEVFNGCGVSGVAEKLTDSLRAKGFDVVKLGNYLTFEVENTIVIDRNENSVSAKKVAMTVGLDKESVIQQINSEYLLDVTLILGKDYKKLIPLQKRSN